MKKVYFIKPIGMDGPIKVGCSVSPTGRRSSLESWSPLPLEIIAEIPGDYRTERQFHALFADTHQRREWFNPSDLITATVAAINTGTFDVGTLPEPIRMSHKIDGERIRRTPEQRLGMSYSHRLWRTQQRTGYAFPARHYGMIERQDAVLISLADAYLAAPDKVGRPIEADWARALRAAA